MCRNIYSSIYYLFCFIAIIMIDGVLAIVDPLKHFRTVNSPFHLHSYTDGRSLWWRLLIIRLTSQTAKFMDYSELGAIIMFSILFKDTSGCILKVWYSAHPPILADSRNLSVCIGIVSERICASLVLNFQSFQVSLPKPCWDTLSRLH